jgi:peptidoglycan LD-endopeptidase CwlK
MASRQLEHLHPRLKEKALVFLDRCKMSGIDVLIYCTYRSNREQSELYELGRSKPGRIVTNAKGGQSNHNFTIDGKPASKAFDCVPLLHGKPQWSNKEPVWQEMGRIGTEIGLMWGGHWTRFREYPHFELIDPPL